MPQRPIEGKSPDWARSRPKTGVDHGETHGIRCNAVQRSMINSKGTGEAEGVRADPATPKRNRAGTGGFGRTAAALVTSPIDGHGAGAL